MKLEPVITVAIPVFNRPALVKIALESALRQPFDDLEVLVVDNASTDGTWDVLSSYQDPRLRLVRNDHNVGLFGNFNRCLTLARGRYVCTLCSDDILCDGFLAPARAVLDHHPAAGVVSTRGRARIEDTGTFKPLGVNLPAGLYARDDAVAAALWAYCTYYTNPFNYPSGILLRSEVARASGLMDEHLGFTSDVKLYLRMLESTDLAILDVTGCEVMLHAGQEGDKIYGDARALTEFVDHFRRHSELLARHRLETYVRSHVAGYLYGSYLKLKRSGNATAARACLALLEQGGFPRLAGLLAGFDSLRKRAAIQRNTGTRSPVPYEPLHVSTEAAA